MDNSKPVAPDECGYKCGELNKCAPLASTWVPMQQDDPPVYGSCEALTRGTLFPGLDLPFMNMVNRSNPYAGTPLGELMSLSFVIKELQLYLDTHPHDEEAFKALKETIALEKEGRSRYVKRYGPIDFSDVEQCGSYAWLNDPWPWEYSERTDR